MTFVLLLIYNKNCQGDNPSHNFLKGVVFLKLIETFIMVPKQNNDGKAFPPSKYDNLNREIIEQFGGLTIEHATGFWSDGEKVYQDRNYKYIIGIQSLKQVAEILELARYIRKEFKQEAVYVNVSGIAEIVGDEEA